MAAALVGEGLGTAFQHSRWRPSRALPVQRRRPRAAAASGQAAGSGDGPAERHPGSGGSGGDAPPPTAAAGAGSGNLSATGKPLAPWTMTFDLRERETIWTEENQARRNRGWAPSRGELPCAAFRVPNRFARRPTASHPLILCCHGCRRAWFASWPVISWIWMLKRWVMQ